MKWLCLLLLITQSYAKVYYDQEMNRALVLEKTEGDSFRAFTCQAFDQMINQYTPGNYPHSMAEATNCRELTTKFLPIRQDDLNGIFQYPLTMPTLWAHTDPKKVWEEFNRTETINLDQEEFSKIEKLFSLQFDRRNKIVQNKVTPFRLRVQHDPNDQKTFDPNKAYTTCTASLMKIDGKCHLFTNEHCITSHPNVMTLDIPEFSSSSWNVTEKEVAPEWDLLSLNFPNLQKSRFCKGLDEPVIEKTMERTPAFYSLGYSGRSGENKMDIFSSQVDQVKFLARDTATGSRAKVIDLEFPGGTATTYNYLPTFRGMSGGVLTDKEGNPLCLIHRTIPQQDTPQCIDRYQLKLFTKGELPRAKPEDNLLHPELFMRTFEKNRLNQEDEEKGKVKTGNTTIPPGNTAIPPGNTAIPPGNTAIPPGNTSIPPGNTSIPPGNTSIPPGNTAIPPGLLNLKLITPSLNLCDDRRLLRYADPKRDLGEFIEALEGVIDHNDGEKRELLAIRCKEDSPWQQIDGYEDYRNKVSHLCGDLNRIDEKNRVYRDEEGYVPLKYRETLLHRLEGNFFSKAHKSAGRLLHYNQLPNDNSLLTAKKKMAVFHRVKVDPEKGTIDLQLGNRPGPFVDGALLSKFHVSYSDNGKKIKLRPQYKQGQFPGKDHFGEMTCANKNHLKLICTGKTSAFSLSLKNDGEMAVRFSSYDPVTRQMIHTHGDIYEDNGN